MLFVSKNYNKFSNQFLFQLQIFQNPAISIKLCSEVSQLFSKLQQKIVFRKNCIPNKLQSKTITFQNNCIKFSNQFLYKLQIAISIKFFNAGIAIVFQTTVVKRIPRKLHSEKITFQDNYIPKNCIPKILHSKITFYFPKIRSTKFTLYLPKDLCSRQRSWIWGFCVWPRLSLSFPPFVDRRWCSRNSISITDYRYRFRSADSFRATKSFRFAKKKCLKSTIPKQTSITYVIILHYILFRK